VSYAAANTEQFSFQMRLESGDGIAELIVAGDREFQTAGDMLGFEINLVAGGFEFSTYGAAYKCF